MNWNLQYLLRHKAEPVICGKQTTQQTSSGFDHTANIYIPTSPCVCWILYRGARSLERLVSLCLGLCAQTHLKQTTTPPVRALPQPPPAASHPGLSCLVFLNHMFLLKYLACIWCPSCTHTHMNKHTSPLSSTKTRVTAGSFLPPEPAGYI